MNRPNAKVMDSEREKFRTYLEKSGVMSVFTDVLVHLYEEPSKPNDALSYVKNALGTITVEQRRLQMYQDKVAEQESTIESQKKIIDALEKEVADLKQQLSSSQAETDNSNTKTEEALPLE